MNKIRRKTLQELYDIIADAKDNLDEVRDEEDDYKENIPENLQGSERYEIAEAAVDALESAISSLEELEKMYALMRGLSDEQPLKQLTDGGAL